jgi:hypothetical protein
MVQIVMSADHFYFRLFCSGIDSLFGRNMQINGMEYVFKRKMKQPNKKGKLE